MTSDKTIYFMRHGETEWNAQRRIQGQYQSRLTRLGRQQATINAHTIARLGVDTIFASPLERAHQSAKALAKITDLPVALDPKLKEWNAGAWSGYLYAEVEERWPKEWAAWQRDKWHFRPPGCENCEDMHARGSIFLAKVLATPSRRNAIVSHGFIGRIMMSILLGLSPDKALSIETRNDTLYRLRAHNGIWLVDHFTQGNGPLPGLSFHRAITAP